MRSLSDICEYRKGKVLVSELNRETYISTENLLPNKGGLVIAASLPTTEKTQEVKAGQADKDCGCSNDVLVFNAKEGVDPVFLYYVLADDRFFDYSTNSAKGTKMPRGDKTAIMQYQVPEYDLHTQVLIGKFLRELDQKIKVNEKINRNLAEQARLIYSDWFVDYGHFGGTMPKDWMDGVLGDLAEIKTSTFKPDKEPDVIVEHYSIPALDEKHFPVFEIASGIKSNKYLLSKQSVMISKLNPDTKRIWRPLCLSEKPVCSTEFIVFEASNSKNKDFIYSIIDSVAFSNHLCANVTGSTGSRQRAVPKATLGFEVKIPPQYIIDDFSAIVTPIYDLIAKNEMENQRLAETRDKLLPKLMSGELDVSDLDI